MNIQSIGIIGLGSFGTFIASLVPAGLPVLGYDTNGDNQPTGVELAPLATVATADVVFLAIPLGAYPKILQQLATLLPPATLLIDICSVKTQPVRLIHTYLPDHHNLLLTHPLFGPQSAAQGTAGHTLIVTKAAGKCAAGGLQYCIQQLGLTVQRMTSAAHDQAMAEVQALTFFVARGLRRANIGSLPFQTPSFQMLLDLVTFDQTHSDELFQTIQQGNPYAQKTRQRLIDAFSAEQSKLQNKQNKKG